MSLDAGYVDALSALDIKWSGANTVSAFQWGRGAGKLEPKFFIINILIQNLYLSGIPVSVMF